MNFQSTNLDIKTDERIEEKCLYLSFKGKFTESSSIQGTKALIEELEAQPSEFFIMIWDCTDMTGFELAARKEWYKFIKTYNKRIESVTVISNKVMIRGASRVMLEMFGINSNIIKSIKQLSLKC